MLMSGVRCAAAAKHQQRLALLKRQHEADRQQRVNDHHCQQPNQERFLETVLHVGVDFKVCTTARRAPTLRESHCKALFRNELD